MKVSVSYESFERKEWIFHSAFDRALDACEWKMQILKTGPQATFMRTIQGEFIIIHNHY